MSFIWANIGSRRWGPSRVRDVRFSLTLPRFVIAEGLIQEFLFYQEKDPEPVDVDLNSDSDTTSVRFLFLPMQLTSQR